MYTYIFIIIYCTIPIVEQDTTTGSSVESTKKYSTIFNRRCQSGNRILESGYYLSNIKITSNAPI